MVKFQHSNELLRESNIQMRIELCVCVRSMNTLFHIIISKKMLQIPLNWPLPFESIDNMRITWYHQWCKLVKLGWPEAPKISYNHFDSTASALMFNTFIWKISIIFCNFWHENARYAISRFHLIPCWSSIQLNAHFERQFLQLKEPNATEMSRLQWA